jgi:Beta-lactamase enzyme family
VIRAVACAVLVAAALVSVARADDAELLAAVEQQLPRIETVRGVQARYDAARELELALGEAEPVSGRCRSLARAALAYARGWVEIAEGIDRPRPALYAAGNRRVRQASRTLDRLGRTCRAGKTPAEQAAVRQLEAPRSYAAAFGLAVAPFGGRAELRANGRVVARSANGRFHLALAPGRYDLEVRGLGGRLARSEDVWVLPASAARVRPPRGEDAALGAELESLGRSFPGFVGLSVREFATGRTAEWNADARFPAASTVKLGVLVAALDRLGAGPAVLAELRALTAWSSNLAANRLETLLGGDAPVQAALRRLGAPSSTYPGPYRVGTARADVVRQPPIVSLRVTTASDLTRAMSTLHAAAAGDGAARARLGLSRAEAQLALGLLLSSENSGPNAGLLRAALPRTPIAQKQGWLSSARHTTAVVYAERGPVAVTILTYRPGITLAEAQRLGTAVARLLHLQ